MGITDARNKELLEGAQAPGVVPGPPEQELAVLKEAVSGWSRVRDEHLNGILNLLSERTKDPLIDKWKDKVRSLQDGLATFCKVQDRLPPPASEWSRNFIRANGEADAKVLTVLEKAGVAMQIRDTLVQYADAVTEETKNLEVKWNAIVSEHQSHKEREEKVLADVRTLIETSIQAAKELDGRLGAVLAAGVQKLRDGLDQLPEGGANAIDFPVSDEGVKIAASMVDRWKVLRTGIDDQRARFELYFQQDAGGPLLVFGNFRADTQRFIDKFGYGKALEAEERARSALDALVSEAGTSSGNIDDNKQFAEAAKILLKAHVTNAKDIWDEFVRKHEQKFFGPVGPDFARALLDQDLFEEKYERLQAANLLELTEKWRDKSRNTWDVDFSGIPSEVVDAYKYKIGAHLLAIDAELKEPLLDRFRENFKIVLQNVRMKIKLY